jgi:hypothetical protein
MVYSTGCAAVDSRRRGGSVCIGVSTCFGHFHAHHQENSTKTDNAYGVQHWLCCSRLKEKRWIGVHLLELVKPIPTSAHYLSASNCLFIHLHFSMLS